MTVTQTLMETGGGMAGGILMLGTAIVALLLKARKVWSRDTRDIKYDEGQSAWVTGLQLEITLLRKEKDELWKQRVEDIHVIAELKAGDAYLRKELAQMVSKVEDMGDSINKLRARLCEIDRNCLL